MNLCSDNNFFHFFFVLNHFIFQVNFAKSSMVSCSARLLKTGSCKTISSNKFLTALRKVFRRWLNAVFTSRKKALSFFIDGYFVLGIKRITALFTFGGGENEFSFTSNKYSTEKKACISTLSTP